MISGLITISDQFGVGVSDAGDQGPPGSRWLVIEPQPGTRIQILFSQEGAETVGALLAGRNVVIPPSGLRVPRSNGGPAE